MLVFQNYLTATHHVLQINKYQNNGALLLYYISFDDDNVYR